MPTFDQWRDQLGCPLCGAKGKKAIVMAARDEEDPAAGNCPTCTKCGWQESEDANYDDKPEDEGDDKVA